MGRGMICGWRNPPNYVIDRGSMSLLQSFLTVLGLVFAGMAVAAIFTRVAFAITQAIARAPYLDFFVSLFTWLPWAAGFLLDGWLGLLAAVVAQVLFLHAFCLVHRLCKGKKGRTLTDVQGKVLGPVRNQLCLLVQTPAIPVFVMVRVAELVLYPAVAAIGRLPTYRQAEWVNLSRHNHTGLAGYDLLWCWYCDWMTGLWALGTEMLRNIESFWCPIQFGSPEKNTNVALDFPDVKLWAPASSTAEEAADLIEKYYSGREKLSWWGHPDRRIDQQG